MRETLKNAWKIVEIRKKILYTLFMLLVFRLLLLHPPRRASRNPCFRRSAP